MIHKAISLLLQFIYSKLIKNYFLTRIFLIIFQSIKEIFFLQLKYYQTMNYRLFQNQFS